MFLVQILCISTPNDTVFWTKYRRVIGPVFRTRGSNNDPDLPYRTVWILYGPGRMDTGNRVLVYLPSNTSMKEYGIA